MVSSTAHTAPVPSDLRLPVLFQRRGSSVVVRMQERGGRQRGRGNGAAEHQNAIAPSLRR
ncbi:hypothetical protein [Arthrobacter sp.]|uniref:hypothetical protein n=1 Tax=Arthrobacter sp. TaxID=1667 RepID=UPI002811EA50|nr:hypothetical protein [Arthrobacter sp.]